MIATRMAHSTQDDRILAVLHGASALGIDMTDAADVYTWGLTREFAALQAACRAHIAAAGGRRLDRRPVMLSRGHLRKVIGDDR